MVVMRRVQLLLLCLLCFLFGCDLILFATNKGMEFSTDTTVVCLAITCAVSMVLGLIRE